MNKLSLFFEGQERKVWKNEKGNQGMATKKNNSVPR